MPGGDALGYGLPRYHVRRTIDEVEKAFGDREYILYVDVTKQDAETELGRLAHDLLCPRAADMYSPILAAQVRKFKETEEGVEEMVQELDWISKEMYEAGVERGEQRGEKRGIKIGELRGEKRGMEMGEKRGIELGELRGFQRAKRENARAFSRLGISAEQIAQAMNESVSQVQSWIAEGVTAGK